MPEMNAAIVIPTYNERENIGKLVPMLRSMYPTSHVWVVDDNSPDKTWEVVEAFAREDSFVHLVFRKSKQGLAQAYVNGFEQALETNPDVVVQMDADFSHDPKVVGAMLERIDGHDLVIGSRYLRGIAAQKWGWARIMTSYLGNLYIRFWTGLNIKDATGGFKCFRAGALKGLDLKTNVRAKGYAFQIEVNYLAKAMGYSILEVPITFRGRDVGESKFSAAIFFEALLKVPMLRFRKFRKPLSANNHSIAGEGT